MLRGRRAAVWPVAAVLAACVLVVVLLASSPGQQRSALFSQPFDSNLPVQWDSSAHVDLDGLSRYYSAASAHLRNAAPHAHMALKSVRSRAAREMQLAQMPQTQQLGQSNDWDEQHWSPEHYINVAGSRVDDITAKGIWKNKDEAWDGIDKVLPTDTRYEYQTMHTGHGQEAKMEAFLDHAHHQLKLLQDQLPSLAADKSSKKELDTLRGVISVGEDALEKIERDTVKDDADNSHVKIEDELSDQDLGLSDKFKVLKGKQLRQQDPKPLLDIQPDSVLNIDASDPAVWGGGDPFKNMGKPSFHSRSARRQDYENSRTAKSEMASYFQSLDSATQRENRRNARRAGEGLDALKEREDKALDHSTRRDDQQRHALGLDPGARQVRATEHARAGKQQARRFVLALAHVLRPNQVQELKSSSDSCGVCIAVMGCKDCCELFCAGGEASEATAKPVPKCSKSDDDEGDVANVECEDDAESVALAAVAREAKLEGKVGELQKELRATTQKDEAEEAALEAKVGKAAARKASTKSARAPCECTTAECKECPDSDYDARARFSARQAQREREAAYPTADAKDFKALFKKAVKEAGKAAVEAAMKEDGRRRKASRQPCECDSADCGNCPPGQENEVIARRGARGRSNSSSVDAKVEADKKRNDALKKAEKAVARSNAILQERVAALEATNAMAIRQGLGVYGELSGDDSEWQDREPFPGKSETVGKTVLQPAMDLQKQLFGARRQIARLKQELKASQSAGAEAAQAKSGKYEGKGKANEDILPFYEQPSYGGRQLVHAIREYRKEAARGVAAPY